MKITAPFAFRNFDSRFIKMGTYDIAINLEKKKKSLR